MDDQEIPTPDTDRDANLGEKRFLEGRTWEN